MNWLLTNYAEKGGLLEIMRAWDEPCAACGGKGLKEATVCPTCHGAKIEHRVRWR